MSSTIESKPPHQFSSEQVDEFEQAVREGGEVEPAGLRDRLMSAQALVLLREERKLAAVAALKTPLAAYRTRVSESAGVELPAETYPFELGWVYVYPFARGRKYSQAVSSEALSKNDGRGVFATSRADNAAMHATLTRLGFRPAGSPYRSQRGDQALQLFLRPAGAS
jgi:GNAT superfamily N-acetyltransferase